MRILWSLGFVLAMTLAAVAQAPADTQKTPTKGPGSKDKPASTRVSMTIQDAEKLPGGLRGQIARFPVGRKQDHLTGTLYIPSHYDPARQWPVLVDGTRRNGLGRTLNGFVPEAEKHSFLLLGVEYLYFAGEKGTAKKVWTRQGEGTVTSQTRTPAEFLADMPVDEQTIQKLLKDLSKEYRVNTRAVGVTGFLGAGLMAYRLPMTYPKLFCVGIPRSAGFSKIFMPRKMPRAAQSIPFYVIFGEKEKPNTLKGTEDALAFLKSAKFKRVTAEKIPHSGVDPRADIAANCFRATVDEIVGQERAKFDRIAGRTGRLLERRLLKTDLSATGKVPTANDMMSPLEGFITKHPKSKLCGQATLLVARLHAEHLGCRAKAEELLTPFSKSPLLRDAAAPAALLYLVEKIMDTQANAEEATRLLKRVRSLRNAPKAIKDRAAELLKELRS